MSKGKWLIRIAGCGLLTAVVVGGGADMSFGETDDMSAMMAEGIPYETEAASHKAIHHAKHATHADMEAMMGEGIPYAHSKEVIIHARSTHQQNVESDMAEGIAYDDSMDLMRQNALQTMPAAGK